jgi:DNA polymerase III subunit gamma/tau
MGKALYRKYRSKNLSEVVGQEHITTALANALKKGAISHAYLLTGPRGTGKTSTARILAHEVNGLPYDEEQTHLDIIEIDAASNRRIDEIRELRERVHTAPSSAKYKVYIIDEVHMLTKEAFNALLKTLEEPPEHVIFILATTEAHKLPETIISRTQRYTFKPIEPQLVINHLRSIAKTEKIDITDDALALIARHGDGSFRDSISLLDQTRNIEGAIDAAEVNRLLGVAPAEAIAELWEAIRAGEAPRLIELLTGLRAQGYQSAQLAKQLAKQFRQALLEGDPVSDKLMSALKALLEVPVSHDADTALELVLLDLVLKDRPVIAKPISGPSTPELVADVTPSAPTKPKPEPKIEAAPPPADPPKAMDTVVETPAVSAPTGLNAALWQEVLEAVKQRYKTLYSVIRMAQTDFSGDAVTLSFKFAFHQKRLNEAKNKQVIIGIIREKTGQDIAVTIAVNSDAVAAPAQAAATKPSNSAQAASPASPSLEAITNVFGGGEVLDS